MATDSATDESDAGATANPIRRFAIILLSILAFIFFWYLIADRKTPWTDQARVQAWVLPITPKVSGKVKKVLVERDQFVKPGELLAVIDPTKYELAVERAEAALEMAGQEMGAGTAAIQTAQAQVVESRAKLDEYELQASRILAAAKKGGVAQADADSANAEVEKAKAQLAQSEAQLEEAKKSLGAEGNENAKVRDAMAALEQARIDLADTKLYAPAVGGITNLKIDEGYYAKAGVPLMTFVSGQEIWIQANFRENNIGNLKVGDKVEIALDMAPGEIHKGTVGSIGFAVKQPSYGAAGEAVTIKAHGGWLRDAQRFPVVINLDEPVSETGDRFVGGQADVIVYTQSSNFLLNGLGKLWIRLLSRFSYAY